MPTLSLPVSDSLGDEIHPELVTALPVERPSAAGRGEPAVRRRNARQLRAGAEPNAIVRASRRAARDERIHSGCSTRPDGRQNGSLENSAESRLMALPRSRARPCVYVGRCLGVYLVGTDAAW
jgi:hypothetical protein